MHYLLTGQAQTAPAAGAANLYSSSVALLNQNAKKSSLTHKCIMMSFAAFDLFLKEL